MKYNELKQHAEMCQMAADEMAYQFTDFIDKSGTLSIFQSICDFNLFWIYSIAPEVVLHIKTIEFLKENIKHFKRKISIPELMIFDTAIMTKQPENFGEDW